MDYQVRTYLNDGEGRFDAFAPTDALAVGPVIAIQARSEHEALDLAWRAGNPQTVAEANAWNFRSLSVADILVIGRFAWAVDRAGFLAVPLTDVIQALKAGQVSHRGTLLDEPCDCGKGEWCPQFGREAAASTLERLA